jgi:hypothetical protein
VVIELLQFRVIPEDRTEEFIDADAAVWGPWLTQQRGYLRKTATVYPGGIVHLRIYWATQRDLDKAGKSPEIPSLDVKLRSQFLGVFQRFTL